MSPMIVNSYGFGAVDPVFPTISGLVLRLEADSGVYSDTGTTLAVNGDLVRQWNDQSGNGNHYGQATSGTRPTYTTGVVHSRPVLRFDGGDDLAGITVTAPFTIAIVTRRRSGFNTFQRALGGSNNWLLSPYQCDYNCYMGSFLAVTGAPQNPSVGGRNQAPNGYFARLMVTNNNSGTGKLYVNNRDRTTTNAASAPGTLHIGGAAGFAAEGLIGDVCAVIVYNNVISSGDRALLDTYLKEKWTYASSSITDPAGVAGCLAWFDAEVGTYTDGGVTAGTSDGDLIQYWLDRSGNGHVASQEPGSSGRPAVKTNILNGYRVIRFDNSDDNLASSVVIDAAHTAFVVYAEHSSATGNHRALGGAVNWLFGPYGGKHSLYAGGFVDQSQTVVADTFVVAGCTNSLTASKYYVNGTEHTTTGTNVGVPYGLTVGNDKMSAFGEPLNGDVAEWLVYDGVLGTTDRQAVESYLRTKYGL